MWIAIHFYHDNKAVDLLHDLIVPLSNQITKIKLSDQFFFINYFDDLGLHVRLRFRIPGSKNKIAVLATVKNKIESLVHDRLPLKSFQFMEYEPEVDRYGGELALAVAERHFHASSQTVLALLKKDRRKFSAQSIANALDMHLCLLHSIRSEPERIEKTLTKILNHWIHSAVQYHRTVIPSQTDHEQIIMSIRQAFADSFQKQQEAIFAHYQSLWQDLESGRLLKKPLDKWNDKVKGLYPDLLDSFKHSGNSPEHTSDEDRAMIIYESYIHMTNNRLGISNTDEAFIAHILLQIWQMLCKN